MLNMLLQTRQGEQYGDTDMALHRFILASDWEMADRMVQRQPELLIVKDKHSRTPFWLLGKACLSNPSMLDTLTRWSKCRRKMLAEQPGQLETSIHDVCLKELLLAANWKKRSLMHLAAGCKNEQAGYDLIMVLCQLAWLATDGVRQLLKVQDRYKGYPMHHAAAADNLGIVQLMLLVAKGVKPDRTLERHLLRFLNTRRKNALMCAACGHPCDTDAFSSAAVNIFE